MITSEGEKLTVSGDDINVKNLSKKITFISSIDVELRLILNCNR